MNTNEFAHKYPKAFNKLPAAYRADDCLTFFEDVNGNLCCRPKSNQLHILGDWEAVYDASVGKWV